MWHVREVYGRRGPARAVCGPAADCRIRLHDALEKHVTSAALAHPDKTGTTARAKSGDDRPDPGMLADLPGSGITCGSLVPDKHYRDPGSVVRTRPGCVRDVAWHKNKVHAMPARCDHRPPAHSLFSMLGMLWLSRMDLPGADRMSLDAHTGTTGMATGHATRTGSGTAGVAGCDDRARLSMDVPGISYVTAVTLMPGMVDIGRFGAAEEYVAGGGVVSSTHRSSVPAYRGGSTTRRRVGLCVCATRQPGRSPSPPLRRLHGTTRGWGGEGRVYERRIRRRRDAMEAGVAVARSRMLWITRRVPTDNEGYRTQDRRMTERKSAENAASAS